MFLRGKKPDGVLKQPKDKEPENKPKPKALGGWSDDEAEPTPSDKDKDNVPASSTTNDEPIAEAPVSKPNKKDQFRLYPAEELSDRLDLEYENKLVDQVTQPGGIRIKPNEALLAEFCKAAKTLDVPIIGSLLLSRLELDLSYAIKAKALYTMEYISKKIDKYLAYFRRHMDYIKGLPVPGDNEQQYQSLLEDISKSIQGVEKTAKEGGDNLLEFNDPGYNIQPKREPLSNQKPFLGIIPKTKTDNVNKGPSKVFISPEEMKKKKQEETKKTAESVNILESVPPTSPAPPKEAEKLDIFSIGDLSGLTLNNSTPATTTQTTNPVPAPGSFDLYGTKQPSYPQQFYQQPMQGVLPGVPYGYPYGQAQNMMPLNQIAYGGGYNGQSHVGATFQQSPASYPFNAGKPSSTVPITGANLYASPPTK